MVSASVRITVALNPGACHSRRHGVSQIAAKHVDDRQSVHVVHSFAMRARVAEAQPGFAARGVRRQPSVDVVLNREIEMRAHLVGAIAIVAPAVDEAPQTHDAGSITRLTAAESCAQRVDSRVSSRRPFAVRL